MNTKKFLTPTEVTEILGISYSTFIRYVSNGLIPHFKIGRQIRVPESFIDDLMNGSHNEMEARDES